MPYHTAGGWIQAFNQAVNDLLATRSGPVKSRRFQASVCTDHPGCIVIEWDSQRDHVPWRETHPAVVAGSLVNRLP